MDYRYQQVFKPGAYPEDTYVVRQAESGGFTYEQRLRQSLALDGFLTYIVGPSKSGKTVLCENVVGKDHLVKMTGSDFSETFGFWDGIARKIELPTSGVVSEMNAVVAGAQEKRTNVESSYFVTKDKTIEYFLSNQKVLLLDDFHYAPEKVQNEIAHQLKEVIREGFKAIIVSLPNRSDDAIRLNPDLSGRIQKIEISPWGERDLEKIAEMGFSKLGISVQDRFIERMAVESVHSPQLMQSICLGFGLLDIQDNSINDESIDLSCHLASSNLPYEEVVRVLQAGPPTRGQKRKHYLSVDGSQMDTYSILLYVISKNPPLVEIPFDELMNRIRSCFRETTPSTQSVRNSLMNLQKIIKDQELIYKVLEWKDDRLFVQDNLFLFYLRWAVRF